MRTTNALTRHIAILVYGTVLGMAATLCVVPWTVVAAETPVANKSGSGTFVSFKAGTLTIKGSAGLVVYMQVGENYKSFQNNEDGPGSKLVDTIDALSRVMPGTVMLVNVADREISFGLDYRVIGTLDSYHDGKLHLLAADVPQGFVQKPTGNVEVNVDRNIPVLESVDGGDYRYVGISNEVLKTVLPGTMVTARSEYDPEVIEVIQIGTPKRKMERYVGQTRGPVRGTFVSFRDDVLRIQGRGLTSLAANEYDRVIASRIADHIPVVESIDGGAYTPAGGDALKSVKEGTIVTIRQVENVVLEIQIGVADKP